MIHRTLLPGQPGTKNLQKKYGEIELARMVKSLGGRWDRQKKLWELPLRQAKLLRLEDRIINTGEL